MRPTDATLNLNRIPVFGARDKIAPQHLNLKADLYVRQSTPGQIRDNCESRERQYALSGRLKMLGWMDDQIEVIDDDLGRSGSGSVRREGFQRLLSEITAGRVGIVIGLEMSRLARNSKDWHDLFEVCAIYGTLIADEDGVYDPQIPNDRLILGMKGIISEMELHTMRIRLERGRLNKAQRGEMFANPPAGYVKTATGVVEKNPDERAQSAIRLIFDKFGELGSCHAMFHYFVSENIQLPLHDDHGNVVWRVPGKTTLNEILHHPLYAGTYGYSRHKNYKSKYKPVKESPKELPPEQWKVLIHDRYPAYISWEQYQRNQEKLRENCSRKKQPGRPRQGSALLGGIVFCGHCGRKLHPQYATGAKPGYHCNRHLTMAVAHACQGVIQCAVLDEIVAQQVLEAIQPAGVELSLTVLEDETLRRKEHAKQLRQQLEHARYQAQLAERRYQAVDPENRLVARTLEQQWEQSLRGLRAAEEKHELGIQDKPVALGEAERQQLFELGSNMVALWHAPSTSNKDRKEIIRCVIDKVTAAVQGTSEFVDVTIQWAGGFTSQHQVIRRVAKYTQLRDHDVWAHRLIELRRQGKRAPEIAEILNREGYRMARQRREFTTTMVHQLIRQPRFRDPMYHPKLSPHEWRLEDLAEKLRIPEKKLRSWILRGWVHATQRPFGATWVVWADDQELDRLRQLQDRPDQNQHPSLELRTPRVTGNR